MKFKKFRLLEAITVTVSFVILICMASGCATTSSTDTQIETLPVADGVKLITDIMTDEDSAAFHVTVVANRPLTYTAVKQVSPLGIIFYFPKTALDIQNRTIAIDSSTVSNITASELEQKGSAARVEIQLKEDTIYDVVPAGNGIKVSFTKPQPAVPSIVTAEKPDEPKEEIEAKPEAIDLNAQPAASKLESVYTVESDKDTKIKLLANGVIKDYKSFTITKPQRIVFDISGLKLSQPQKKEQQIPVNDKWVKTVRYFEHPDKIRIVIDTTKAEPAPFAAIPVENGLLIQVGSDVLPAVQAAKKVVEVKDEPPTPVTSSKPSVKPENVKSSLASAWVNRIDFAGEPDGKSTLIIGTTHPIQYNIKKESDKRIQLKLLDTQIPDYRKRPLITTRFQSAVDRILPFEAPALKNTTLFAIELREAVPYSVEQSDNLLMVHFESSSISPKPLDEAKLPAWQTVMSQTMLTATAPEKPVEKFSETATTVKPAAKEVVQVEEPVTGTVKEYTGEKISLDFYDTDIKNVFRILREVSRKNFAIDKGVAGKVTLTLEQPVPWDQVLDLILKMNGLGMTHEGDIIRIAQQETLEKEFKLLQEKLAAERKAKRDEEKEGKELEPLVTEYISVNYANASNEVLPKVKPLSTKGRGDITVDNRNNQLIVTDIASVIEQIRQVVKKIDKVTPQVLIEARIVEATNDFTRRIGTQWGVKGNLNQNVSNTLGGTLSYEMSATNPIVLPKGSIGINFTRLAGTPFELINARLSASETENDINIISAPRILTLNNKEAVIRQGLEFPYNRFVDGEVRTEWKEVELSLKVQPLVTPDQRVNLLLKVTNNELGGATITGEQTITTKEAETELLVNDGETIVIGGIRKAYKWNTIDGVPAMKDIPVLGWLFKSKEITDKKDELLIFITPQIVQLEQREG